jgi:hypothetical protein
MDAPDADATVVSLRRKGDRLNSDHVRRTRHLLGLSPTNPPAASAKDATGFRPYKVSTVGQMTLPASARQRWGLGNGGRVEVADLGFAVVVLPEHGAAELGESWFSSGDLASEAEELLAATFQERGSRSGTS